MRAWILATAVAVMGAAAIPGAPAARAGGGGSTVEPGGAPFCRFLFFATLEGACEDALSEDAVKVILEKDEKGHYRHFVYACPVCSPVVEGLRAYAMRQEFYYSRKGDPMVDDSRPSAVVDMAGRLVNGEAAAKGAALKFLVERWVNRRMDRLRLTEAERAEWLQAMKIGRKKGMGSLPQSAGFEHKSCPSCDGASGNEFEKEK